MRVIAVEKKKEFVVGVVEDPLKLEISRRGLKILGALKSVEDSWILRTHRSPLDVDLPRDLLSSKTTLNLIALIYMIG